MDSSGYLESITQDFRTKEFLVTIRMPDLPIDLEKKLLDVKIVPHRQKRSKDANALLWATIGDIAKATGADKWEVYLSLLKIHGKAEVVAMDVEAVEQFRQLYREIEVQDTYSDDNGKVKAIVYCYHGSSTYNKAEMSVLINDAIEELKQCGLQLPPSFEMQRALEKWGEMHG